MNKPTLIIGCSEKKREVQSKAFDLYTGGIYALIKANLKQPLNHFNILILSAKHGLIEANHTIKPYDQRMPKHSKAHEIARYAKKHYAQASVLLNHYKQTEQPLYVVLSNDYKAAFDAMSTYPAMKKSIKSFQSMYISCGHKGIGDLRGRLKRILCTTKDKETPKPPTLFRSGLSNHDELVGFSQAGADLGASLAYISDIKQPQKLQYLMQTLKSGNKVFLDNGMITEIGKGKFISPDCVFARYINIVKSIQPKKAAQSLSIVVPDDPFDTQKSLQIVKDFKHEIKWLAKRVNVILPIHRCVDVANHAKEMMQALNNIRGISLGVPCKEYISTGSQRRPLRLNIHEIESLLSLKAPKQYPLFEKCHFLALSEVTRGGLFEARKTLCDIYNVTMSCDSCRTTAIMGNNKRSTRIGSVVLREVKASKTKTATTRSKAFLDYGLNSEWDYPCLYEKLMDLINDDAARFTQLWNSATGNIFYIDIDDLSCSDAEAHCKRVICAIPSYMEEDVISMLKDVFWDAFALPQHEPSAFDARAETFARVFEKNERQSVQLQMAV